MSLMKFLVGFFLVSLLLVGQALANPFLVCDPVPKETVTHYILTINGVTETVLPFDLGDGTVRLQYDLEDIPTGTYIVEGKAKNRWGEAEPVFLEFVKALPAALKDFRIE